ncbi:A/G-specific adenine glycosylase [Gorillibacterium massiliense]|uniref:A/G-specific adenine glycosylase n=1 Tax=Gorillibacterium massiliense TaxID=1280390 RepID=UPI0004BBEA38|nr:A/G-specific adenine glycosylase [Gorillibacterium massiliense]
MNAKSDYTVDKEATDYYADRLLEWYRRNKRDLPWRRSKDPYRIWVSEIMLQQTRVDTVIPYYHRFMEKFPTVDALADAPEDDVLKAWEGLGYYSRARNLQSAVREVKEEYGGVVPDDPEQVSSLKGVGPYTAGAIMSIAYNLPEPAVDGNVMRVLSRFFLLVDDIAKPSTRVKIEKLARFLIPDGAAGDFNQGLMELGATVCTPKSPHCLTCPVMERCGARLEGRVEELPVKAKAKPPRLETRAAAIVADEAGRLLIRQRPAKGLLAGMWELPHVQLPDAPAPAVDAAAARGEAAGALAAGLAAADGIGIFPEAWLTDAEHIFSHIRWEMQVFRCRLAAGAALPPHYRWMAPEERERYAFPNLFVRIIDEFASSV